MQNTSSRDQLLIGLPVYGEAGDTRRSWVYEGIKRSLDITVAAGLMILLSPVFLLVAILIKRDSPGPVFYRGPRLGLSGKRFYILKFRTMYARVESFAGPRVTGQGDSRVTAFGRWLRDTKLNELPQVWNVLKGEMSLIGPRPEDPKLAESWPADVRREVLSVRPGITSPASVSYHNEERLLAPGNLMSTYLGSIAPSKIRLDQLYVRHRSVLLDLDVALLTLMVLLPKIGTTTPPEERLFLGPISRLMRRYVSWFVIDLAVTFVAITITGIFWRSLGPLDVGIGKAVGIAIGYSMLFSIVGAVLGVNRVSWSHASISEAVDLIPAVLVSTLIALWINYIWQAGPLLPPGLIVMASILAFAGFVAVRYRSRLIQSFANRWIMQRGHVFQARERILIVGGGEAGQFMAWWLQNGRSGSMFRVIGYVDDDLFKQNTRIRGVDVLGRREDVPEIVSRYDIGIIIFAIHNIPVEERRDLLKICSATPARIFFIPDVLGDLRETRREEWQDSDYVERVGTDPIGKNGRYLSNEQFSVWLDELSHVSNAGDMEAVRAKIQHMRDQVGVSESRT